MKEKINRPGIDRLSAVFKLLAEPSRLRILLDLGLECRPVSAIIAGTGLSQTNVSFHLRALREAGLVKAEKQGPFVFYCLPDPELLAYIEGLAGWLADREAFGGEEASPAATPAGGVE